MKTVILASVDGLLDNGRLKHEVRVYDVDVLPLGSSNAKILLFAPFIRGDLIEEDSGILTDALGPV